MKEAVILASFGGHLEGVSLFGFLQLVQIERKTCIVSVDLGTSRGSLAFDKGELVHAEAQGLSGDAAVLLLTSWGEPGIDYRETTAPQDRTVKSDLTTLLLEGARLADERTRAECSSSGVAEAELWYERLLADGTAIGRPDLLVAVDLASTSSRLLAGPSDNLDLAVARSRRVIAAAVAVSGTCGAVDFVDERSAASFVWRGGAALGAWFSLREANFKSTFYIWHATAVRIATAPS